ncbi:hypothetical protein H7F51_16805 [Novosphingobium flavum]|uniref:Uncharacterized protein n=1 Tax=Novosphingobium flavum TaxID=1778672 RepID=A0A7X1KN19_9SPHN|nr:hypothetical protein [Novosphingobium flavum]MBC2667182.1 hypothetical protein [Novosphingobium flavum]
MKPSLLALPLLALALPAALGPTPAFAQAVGRPISDADDLAGFERRAALAKEIGATEVVVTEGLPLADWELDKGDTYPEWFVHHASMLKVFPTGAVAPFIDPVWVKRMQAIVRQRCSVLQRLNLRAVWRANEPAVLPEAFFTAHPELRGPRIDHPARSTKTHFAPNVDRPEMLAIYRQSIQQLLQACPAVDSFVWTTTDAGSGFDWTPGLYPGANGNADFRDRPVADRVAGFMNTLKGAARDIGRDIRININQIEPRQWMIPTFGPDVLENILRKLEPGLAVNGRQGDGKPYDGGTWGRAPTRAAFYPVTGIVAPDFEPVVKPSGGHVVVPLGEESALPFTARLLRATKDQPMATRSQRLAALRLFASSEVGEDRADLLIEQWNALDGAARYLDVLDFGAMLRFGHVLNRWITRPMVPFPLELTPAEKADWRPFLFQAKGEEQAANLADIQAMRMYEGWGAHLLFQRAVELAKPRVERAAAIAGQLAAAAPDAARRQEWLVQQMRLQALALLLQSADDMVSYQAQLDRVHQRTAKPEADAPLGARADWDREDLMALARREIDTMVALRALMLSSGQPILDLAERRQDETVMRLGPDVAAQLKHKIDTMNAHWRDYDRLSTVPNP